MTLRELLLELDDPRKEAMLAIYDDQADLFHYALGSLHNHQAWEGGYADHIAECIRVNRLIYPVLNNIRPLPFTMAQADISLFLHDAEKPYKYGPEEHPEKERWQKRQGQIMYRNGFGAEYQWRGWEYVKNEILAEWMEKYGFALDTDEINALKYTHGEGRDHRKDERVQGPLAAHVHHCDNTSARIWHDEGMGLG